MRKVKKDNQLRFAFNGYANFEYLICKQCSMSYIFVLYCVYWSLLLPQAAQLRLLFTCPPKNTDTKQLFPREEKHLERGLNPGLQETGLTTTLQLFWTSIRIGGMLAKVWARVQLVFYETRLRWWFTVSKDSQSSRKVTGDETLASVIC